MTISPEEARAAAERTKRASGEVPFVRDPVSGAYSLDPVSGRPFWPPQPVPQPLEAPVQVYRDVEGEYYTDAAKERAAGWVIPNPGLDEVILMREALRMACRRVALRRDPDDSKVEAALVRCADLVAAGTVEQLVEAIITRALSMWVDQNLGADGSPVSAISWRLETRWRQLLFDNKRAVIQSLDGRPSPEAARLRRHVEGMLGLVAPPPLGRNDYVIMPG